MSAAMMGEAGTVLSAALETLVRVQPSRIVGTVAALKGLTVLVDELALPVGSLVSIGPRAHAEAEWRRGGARMDVGYGEVVGFAQGQAIVMLLGQTVGIRAGDAVVGEQVAQTAGVGAELLSRVVDGLGRPIDGGAGLTRTTPRALNPDPVPAMRRRRITSALHTGLRAVDLMTTMGKGQRLGIFAGRAWGRAR